MGATWQNVSVDFARWGTALQRLEAKRKAREDRMRNALEILAEYDPAKQVLWGDIRRFVRATAREGLGREQS